MTAGPVLGNVYQACRGLNVNLVYFHTIKPIDKELICEFKDTKILVIQDAFGLYDAVCEVPDLSVSCYGMPDQFCGWYGTLAEIRKKIGLDIESVRQIVKKKLCTMSIVS